MLNDKKQTKTKKIDFESDESINYKTSKMTTNNLQVVKELESDYWAQLKNGNKIALGKIYNIYIEVLFIYGIQNSQDRSFVMDCIHDLFLDLFKYRKNLSITDNAKYYLFKSLKRKINKKYQEKTNPETEEFFNYKSKIHKNYTDSCEIDIISNEWNLEKKEALNNALSILTSNQREVLFLRFNEGKTYEEISFITGISVQSTRTNVYRAIKSLRHCKIKY